MVTPQTDDPLQEQRNWAWPRLAPCFSPAKLVGSDVNLGDMLWCSVVLSWPQALWKCEQMVGSPRCEVMWGSWGHLVRLSPTSQDRKTSLQGRLGRSTKLLILKKNVYIQTSLGHNCFLVPIVCNDLNCPSLCSSWLLNISTSIFGGQGLVWCDYGQGESKRGTELLRAAVPRSLMRRRQKEHGTSSSRNSNTPVRYSWFFYSPLAFVRLSF